MTTIPQTPALVVMFFYSDIIFGPRRDNSDFIFTGDVSSFGRAPVVDRGNGVF